MKRINCETEGLKYCNLLNYVICTHLYYPAASQVPTISLDK